MARKVETLIITDEGRDKGKTFILTEMPAIQGERWAMQALSLLSNASVSLPRGAEDSGMAGLAAAPLGALPALKALQDPSLDAWWDCVQYQHAPNQMPQKIFPGPACQIEEILTVRFLRNKVLEMHISFFPAGGPSTSGSPSAETRLAS